MASVTRRTFLGATGLAAAGLGAPGAQPVSSANRTPEDREKRPNIVVIMTDDHGYGDLGCHGNPHVRTPHIDKFYTESVRFTNFYTTPVCSPTRAGFMTGRYNFRTGVVDTYMGRSMMDASEITVAEALREAGYRSGIFGKWHLGDNYPMRPIDKGFDESVVHRGGGIAQPHEPIMTSYFNPILQHNGEERKYAGYCTDVFTNEAITFIEKHQHEPFFVFVPTNTAHTPLIIHDRYIQPYRDMGLDEETARVYAMVENIDENVGRLLDTLDELGLSEDTFVMFLSSNGGQFSPGADRYTAGLRGRKTTVYEAGIRVPCLIRWPRKLPGGRDIRQFGAHVDFFPTVLGMCGLPLPDDRAIDGRDLMPLMTGEIDGEEWPERHIFQQWHRGDEPEPFRNAAVIGPRYKLVDGEQLYDLIDDPGEENDIAGEHPDLVVDMRQLYEEWLEDVSASRGYHPVRIHVNADYENPTLLTSQDWRGTDTWYNVRAAHWALHIEQPGRYYVSLVTLDRRSTGRARIAIGGKTYEKEFPEWNAKWTFTDVELPAGDTRLAFEILEYNDEGDMGVDGARFAEIARVG